MTNERITLNFLTVLYSSRIHIILITSQQLSPHYIFFQPIHSSSSHFHLDRSLDIHQEECNQVFTNRALAVNLLGYG